MAISALNFSWLTDPHDLQGMLVPFRVQYVSSSSKRLGMAELEEKNLKGRELGVAT